MRNNASEIASINGCLWLHVRRNWKRDFGFNVGLVVVVAIKCSVMYFRFKQSPGQKRRPEGSIAKAVQQPAKVMVTIKDG